jgi:peptidoglycan hydrolase-like protein with peptidoglycan-binding domain
MRVSSPTRVSVVGFLAGTMALAASLLTPSTAAAADPQAPGNFTGYGFDACVAPSQKVMDAWNLRSPYSAIGIYISGNSRYCGDRYQPNLSRTWVETNASHGWRFIPIHVGYQSPCFRNNSSSRVQKKRMSTDVSTARSQAASDAAEGIAALKKYGFGSGDVHYLDLEWYSRTATCDRAVLEFIDVWTEKLHAAGFKSGVYSSGSAAIAVLDSAKASGRSMTYPDHLWIAWTNKVANTDGGTFVRDSLWDDHQRIHQYHNNVAASYGGYGVTIDKNFLDVGKGSVATSDPKPCGVKMSFSSYPRLYQGDRSDQVHALECLLKERGYSVTLNGHFGSSTTKAIDAFRKTLGWGPTAGNTTNPTWTALLSAGSKPRVLKRGSVGEAVWRLQRALTTAGLSVTINGVFDSKTESAVRSYRTGNGLTSYGTVESSVWSLLQRGKLG